MSKLSERAMLASLHISSWSGMMVDREVTDAVNEDFKAEREAGRYNKRLVKASFFADVSNAQNHARKIHRLLTLPWEDDGTRILASAGFIEYQKKMKSAKEKVEDAVKAFLVNPEEYITEAKTRLGDMFSADDYPETDTLKTKFRFDVEIRGMPEAGDFRAKLSDAATKAVVADIERRTNDRLQAAVNDVFERAKVMVQNLSTKLKEYTPPKDGNRAKGIIRDTLVYNINELADFMPILNITDDERITKLAQQLKAELVDNSPEILRADPVVRKTTISKADAILKKIQAYTK